MKVIAFPDHHVLYCSILSVPGLFCWILTTTREIGSGRAKKLAQSHTVNEWLNHSLMDLNSIKMTSEPLLVTAKCLMNECINALLRPLGAFFLAWQSMNWPYGWIYWSPVSFTSVSPVFRWSKCCPKLTLPWKFSPASCPSGLYRWCSQSPGLTICRFLQIIMPRHGLSGDCVN